MDLKVTFICAFNTMHVEGGREAEETETSKIKPFNHIQTSFTYNADRVVGNGSFGVVF